jgi:crotonobetainyl-CoA:carnitine CoA-transferase CaiB-like acyl-CoA transferase
MVSGPMATALLGDQGADVIKIERPGTGDLIRQIGCSRGGLSAIFTTLNRNKRSVVLDVEKGPGRQLLERIVSHADVFVQNFRPGVVEKMGFGEAHLRRINPTVIYVSIDGFGRVGPRASQPVYDAVIQALSGLAASQADPADEVPCLVRNIVCDKVTSLYAAQAIVAALFARERGAGGQHIRLSMLDAAVAFLWPDVMQADTYLGAGVSPPAPLHGILRAHRTRDGFVTLLAISDAEFAGFCRAIGRPELEVDPRYATVAQRMASADVLATLVGEFVAERTTDEVCERLRDQGVPVAPVNWPGEVHRDPQVLANRLLEELDHPHCGRVRVPRAVAWFEATPASIRAHAPLLGEHTDEVLLAEGILAGDLERLRADGVIY